MTSHKEAHHTRNASQSRPLASPMNVPHRQTGRNHSHSLSLGTLNPTHRVTRRKSMSSNNFLSVTAAVQSIDDASLEALILPQSTKKMETSSKPRNRRASEGGSLSGKERKRVSEELKCETCGKGYKHGSCLTKHLWEHTPEWTVTSKLLISKHQQVQLLEAASVLVLMNQSDADFGEDLKAMEDSNSSAASGSEEHENISSVETTPPPTGDHFQDVKRYSTTSSLYSQSYQSATASSVPTSAYGSYHQAFTRRLSTSGSGYAGTSIEDEAGLSAAVELCHFGTPRTGAIIEDDIPPVPPLPERYASQKTAYLGTTPLHHPQPITPALTSRISDERDVRMHGQSDDDDDDDDDDDNNNNTYPQSISRGHGDDYEIGVFGHMEE